MQKNWKPAALGFGAVVLAAIVIWFSWAVLRPNSDEAAIPQADAPAESPEETRDQESLPDPQATVFPAESGDGLDHYGDEHEHGELINLQVDESARELSTRVKTFEEGFRSLYRGDTAEVRRQRVARVVSSEHLDYLNFEVSDVFDTGVKDYDTVVVVENADAIIGGLTSQLATGRVDLVIDVTYSRHYDNGDVQTLGTLSKRSRWELTERGWLLVGADPA